MTRGCWIFAASLTAGGVLLGLVLVASGCEFDSSPGPMEVKLTSAAPDAKFRVRDAKGLSDWITCPGDYSEGRYNSIYEHSQPVAYVDVSIGTREYHGRILLSYYGYGSSSSVTTEVRNVESLDDSAFVVRKGDLF